VECPRARSTQHKFGNGSAAPTKSWNTLDPNTAIQNRQQPQQKPTSPSTALARPKHGKAKRQQPQQNHGKRTHSTRALLNPNKHSTIKRQRPQQNHGKSHCACSTQTWQNKTATAATKSCMDGNGKLNSRLLNPNKHGTTERQWPQPNHGTEHSTLDATHNTHSTHTPHSREPATAATKSRKVPTGTPKFPL